MLNNATATRLQRATAHRLAQRDAYSDAKDRHAEAFAFLTAGEDFIERGRAAGVPASYLHDFARGLRDEVNNLVGAMERNLDQAGLSTDFAAIDLRDLDALILRLAPPAA